MITASTSISTSFIWSSFQIIGFYSSFINYVFGTYGLKVHYCLILCFDQVLRLRGGGESKQKRARAVEDLEDNIGFQFIPTAQENDTSEVKDRFTKSDYYSCLLEIIFIWFGFLFFYTGMPQHLHHQHRRVATGYGFDDGD